MRDKWQALIDRFEALSTRERILVLVALFAIAYQVGTLVVFDRQFEKIDALNAEIARDNGAILAANQRLASVAGERPVDPNRQLRDRIADQRGELQRIRGELKAAADDLISPRDMARFLEELLLQEPGLRLRRLSTLVSQPLLSREGSDAPPSEKGLDTSGALHRHGFDLEFQGDYLTTLRYLEALEALPWQFFWDSVEFEVVDYPESIVRLRLHTLSLSEDWIGV